MTKRNEEMRYRTTASQTALFERIVSILEEARANVVRSVNSTMVAAYWLIGREIVQELQKGKERAEYGRRLLERLSERLTEKYRAGFSTTNLWYFRQFYQAFKDRLPEILRPAGGEFKVSKRPRQAGDLLKKTENHYPRGDDQKGRPLGDQLGKTAGFHPNLSWSHYRALMRVENKKARNFYETEAVQRRLCQRPTIQEAAGGNKERQAKSPLQSELEL